MISKIDAQIMKLTQLPNETPMEYSKLLPATSLRYDPVHDDYVLKANFITGLQDSIYKRMCLLWALDKHAAVLDLGRHAAYLSSL